MALAVASTSTVSTSNADNLTINKPSGVASGDLLLIIASGYGTDSITSSGFTSALEKAAVIGGDTQERQCVVTLLYKIADSGDVSASTYTIAQSGTEGLGNACMLRVTGWSSGNPLYASSSAQNDTAGGGTTVLGNSSLTLSRPGQQLLIMAHTANSTSGATTIYSMAGYSVTSSDSNPTWTEVIDAEVQVYTSTDLGTNQLSVAYAITSNTSTITAYEATLTDVAAPTTGVAYWLAVLVAPLSHTADVSNLSVTPTLAGAESVHSAGADISHLTVTPTLNGPDGFSTTDGTIWTPINKT